MKSESGFSLAMASQLLEIIFTWTPSMNALLVSQFQGKFSEKDL